MNEDDRVDVGILIFIAGISLIVAVVWSVNG